MKHILTLIQQHIKTNPSRSWLQPFSIFIICSSVLWLLGPHLSIGSHAPLQSIGIRLFIILLMGVGYTAKVVLAEQKEQAQRAALPTAVNKKLQLLDGQLRGAINFLNKPFTNSQGVKYKLNHLPWYLVIGPVGAGKTTLLANSNINFLLKKQIKTEELKNISSSDSCSWWVTHESVLLDVPGNFIASQDTTHDRSVWPHFLNLLKKFRPDHTINGVIVALPLPDLINPETRELLIKNIQIQIAESREKFGDHVPFYFTITKCDLLPGFTEFFGDSASDEFWQAWGVTLPAHTQITALPELFSQRFNILIKRLNKQLIWRLHQERGSLTRVHVKDFPLHVERLKDTLIQVLQTLTKKNTAFNLVGVYLTSAIQPPAENNQSQTTNESQTTLQIMHTPAWPSRSYFIRQLLLQGILNTFGKSNKSWQERRLVYAICAGGIAFTIIFSGYDIIHAKQQMLAMKNSIVVPTFNIVMPEEKPQEKQVSNSVTVIG